MKLLALQFAPNGGFVGFGTLASCQGNACIVTFAKILSTAIGLMTIIGFIWFMFILFTGAIGIIGSGGDKQAYEGARKKITTGLIGLVVLIAAIFILDLVGIIIGVNFLTIDQLFSLIK